MRPVPMEVLRGTVDATGHYIGQGNLQQLRVPANLDPQQQLLPFAVEHIQPLVRCSGARLRLRRAAFSARASDSGRIGAPSGANARRPGSETPQRKKGKSLSYCRKVQGVCTNLNPQFLAHVLNQHSCSPAVILYKARNFG